jgi:tetratricopeptide (TPR) repeat protein
MGEVAFRQGYYEEAKEFFQESKNILKEVGDRLTLAGAVRRLGQIALHKGDVEAAIAACTESLNLNMEAGDHRGVLACLSAFAGIALERGQTEAAARLFGAVQTLLSAMNFRLLQIDHIEFEHNLAALRKQLDQPSLERVWAKGEVMTKEQAIEFALNLVK